MQEWFNRIGLVLQFVALFLLTPDIFGKERMETAATRLRNLTHEITAGTKERINKKYGSLPLGIAARGFFILIGSAIILISRLSAWHWIGFVGGPIVFNNGLSLILLTGKFAVVLCRMAPGRTAQAQPIASGHHDLQLWLHPTSVGDVAARIETTAEDRSRGGDDSTPNSFESINMMPYRPPDLRWRSLARPPDAATAIHRRFPGSQASAASIIW
jgi:hypothetical protein